MANTRILLVDDEELVRRSLEANLMREGFEMSSASSAEDALAILRKWPCDLLLSDYLMEGMTGIELLKKAKELYPQIKVIIFSGQKEKDSAPEIVNFDENGFLCKPIDFEELLERIDIVLKNVKNTPKKGS